MPIHTKYEQYFYGKLKKHESVLVLKLKQKVPKNKEILNNFYEKTLVLEKCCLNNQIKENFGPSNLIICFAV